MITISANGFPLTPTLVRQTNVLFASPFDVRRNFAIVNLSAPQIEAWRATGLMVDDCSCHKSQDTIGGVPVVLDPYIPDDEIHYCDVAGITIAKITHLATEKSLL
jgi:hypothetical protein